MTYLSNEAATGSGARSAKIGPISVYTPDNYNVDSKYVVHNLNSFTVWVKVTWADETGQVKNDYFQAYDNYWGYVNRMVQMVIQDENTILLQFCHDGNGAPYNQWVEVYAFDPQV